jgi:single-strand DNA-binding protein|tara:strand:- start:814 stop:1248 length:435 start_codon:yes stop_codon:yes gene_type:complete
MYNKYICVGNLTRDPETRPVNDSDSVTNLAVAINNPLNKDEVFYADVQAWGKVGENCAKYLSKGKRVLVEGRLKTNSWTSKEGETRNRTYVVANSVQFLSPVGEGSGMPEVGTKKTASQKKAQKSVQEETFSEEEILEHDSVPF